MHTLRFARVGGMLLLGLAVVGGLTLGTLPVGAQQVPHQLLVRSASENITRTETTLPLFQGTSRGRPVWYIVLDSSDASDAARRGVNYAPKLANVRNTPAAQAVQLVDGQVDFPASVDFTPDRQLVPGPTGFPPAAVAAPAVGEAGYSPLIVLPAGIVLNAPQIANATGHADKIVALDAAKQQVVYKETLGLYQHGQVHYISVDASAAGPAAIEDVTLAPALAQVPNKDDESSLSAREGIIGFVNGPTGANNPQRQGLNSALLDQLSPLNIIHQAARLTPTAQSVRYSPLWDMHFAAWTPAAIAQGQNTRQTDYDDVLGLVQAGRITGPGGAPFGAADLVVNCPVISIDVAEAGPGPGMPTTGQGGPPLLPWALLLILGCLIGGAALRHRPAGAR